MDILAKILVQVAKEAMDEEIKKAAKFLDEPTLDDQARAATVAVLRLLVEKHFPEDEDVDYHYATEGLAQDACDALEVLEQEMKDHG